jgi:hypothetical protein
VSLVFFVVFLVVKKKHHKEHDEEHKGHKSYNAKAYVNLAKKCILTGMPSILAIQFG